MPPPTTTDQLLTNLRRSGLVAADRLEAAVARMADDGPGAVLDHLQHECLLTAFQADRLRAGKYKGFVLGDYVILDQLGGGSTGQVYLAEHNVMHRLAALKVLSVSASADTVSRERFFREARATAVLDHPNVIRAHDLRKDGPVYYLIMEYVGGISLQHLVHRRGPLPWPTAAAYVRQAALGLQHTHDHGLVHRDVKPANLLLTHDGTVKLLDLGLVRMTAVEDSLLTEQFDQSILGTADYLAPEQAVASSRVDIRADLYSLGATFYYLLAGRTMFPEGRMAQKLMWQQLREPTPIRDLRPELPTGLAKVVHQLLAKDAAARFQTPTDVLAALAPWTRDPVPPPDANLMPPPPVRRGVAQGIPTLSRISFSDFLLDDPEAGATETGSRTPRPGIERDTPPAMAGLDKTGEVTVLRSVAVPTRSTLHVDGRPTWKLLVIASAVAATFATMTAVGVLTLLK
ncbi:serine/threonine-protein kinase [Limnoglobus roseus]|uniref:Serine/threonine protein kinase n=1 Tax=Limnoglobus roseus TaxID=2598579 RepID=A0A5C1A7M0_9BACT|nr:serine/threonine-protein kinase [Limnoglobus roseus]QEL13986.1 serine/threonine protein kinase [Limnoglobus roseus]